MFSDFSLGGGGVETTTASHTTASHTTASHTTASHTTASHTTASHTTASHTTASHTTASHTTASHTTASHTTASHTTRHSDHVTIIDLASAEMIISILSLLNLTLTDPDYVNDCKSILFLKYLSNSDQNLKMKLLEILECSSRLAFDRSISAPNNDHSAADSAADSAYMTTIYTQLIKQSTSLFMHLFLIHYHSSSSANAPISDTSLEKAFRIIVRNAYSSNTPKVRKLSTNVIKVTLESLAAPKTTHVLTKQCCETMADAFDSILSDSSEPLLLDILGVFRVLLPIFSRQSQCCQKHVHRICENLLTVPSQFTSPIPRHTAFSLLSLLFTAPPADEMVDAIIESVLPMRPWKGESKAWLLLLGQCSTRRPVEIFRVFMAYLLEDGNDEDVVQALGSVILNARDNVDDRRVIICEILAKLNDALVSSKWGSLLSTSTFVFESIKDGHANGQGEEELLRVVMKLRDDPVYSSTFPFKKECESAIQSAICGLGAAAFTKIVPFAIDAESGLVEGGVRRPYLLTSMYEALNNPSIKLESNMQTLSFLPDTLYPLMQRLAKKAGEGKSELEIKLYETMLDQCWTLHPFLITPAHCTPDQTPPDFAQVWPKVVPVIGGVLTGSISWTSPSTLKSTIKSLTFSLLLNQECVLTYTPRFLAALANLYMTPPTSQECQNKGTALQVAHERQMQALESPLSLALSKCRPEMVNEYFLTLLKQCASEGQSVCMDLMMLFLPHIQGGEGEWSVSALGLYLQVLLGMVEETDATLQKKTYKSLVKLVLHPSLPLSRMGVEGVEELIGVIGADTVVAKVTSGAIKNRVTLFLHIVTQRPLASLKPFIEMCLPEVMLATKEANEKTRDAAYDCLIGFARYMHSGGPEMLRDLFLMVTAGLGGESPHMQSSSIATLGRLFFEFYGELEEVVCRELLETVLITMSFKNREVTKAALGFVKVCVVCLPVERLQPHVPKIIKTILLYTHRIHKSHFKSKTRHLFERLIRKFGYEFVDGLVPGDDKKLIMNIKKRRDAAARRKIAGKVENAAVGKSAKPGFEEAFHDSGSELGSDEEEKYIPQEYRNETLISKKDKKRGAKTVIREGDDGEVVDFLDRSVVSQVTHQFVGLNTAKGKSVNKSNGEVFKTGAHGRMVIDESNSDADNSDIDAMNIDGTQQPGKKHRGEISEDYYKQSLASEVSFTRTADGRVKFVKRKRGEAEDEASTTFENGTADTQVGKRWHAGYKKSKTGEAEKDVNVGEMLGRQYKAKKAKGDVKKAGMADPYAYIPLSGKIVGNMNKSTKLDGQLKGILKASTKGGSSAKVGSGGSTAAGSRPKGFSRTNKKHNK